MQDLKPNFIIVGVTKAGTTSVYDWLSHNPNIYLSRVKEPGFFAYAGQSRIVRYGHLIGLPGFANSWDQYLRLFRGAKPSQMRGEATTYYFHSFQAPGLMKALIPSVKLIVILRNPVERVYSHYLMDVRNGYTNRPFEEVLQMESSAEVGTAIGDIGMYASHLKRYLALFSREQFRVFFFDDLVQDPASFYVSLCTYLAVGASVLPQFHKLNDFGEYPYTWWRHQALHIGYRPFIRHMIRLIVPFPIRERIRRLLDTHKPVTKPEMSPLVRSQLIAHYRDQILELQDMTGRDLADWLT